MNKIQQMKKNNWKIGILIAFVLFISFILFFVTKVTTDKDYQYNLVKKDYYKDELEYQEKIDKLTNAKNLKKKLVIEKKSDGILIKFPAEFQNKQVRGMVHLYRPSNQSLDRVIPLTLSNLTLLIPKKMLVNGRWDIHVEWSCEQTKYLTIKSLNF